MKDNTANIHSEIPIKTNALHLLIAEDDVTHIEAIRRAFEEAGANVYIRAVGTLREYRVYIEGCLPDLALLDLNLPDGRAVDVLTNPPEDAPFPILVMTAFGSQPIVVEVMKAGALDYVVKSPEMFTAMPRTVERIIHEWSLHQQHKQAREALRNSETRYRALFESSSEGIIITDSETKIEFANEALLQMFGYTEEELKVMSLINLHPEDTWSRIQNQLKQQTGGGKTSTFDIACVRKDGSIFYADITGTEITIDGKQHIVGFFRDITERKQADALRISLEEQLRLQQRLETVGQLAAGVAHDFNNILTGITGFTQFALDSLPAAGATREDLIEVLTLAKRAAELTSQLLAFSRRQPLQPIVLNINDVISNLANMLGRLLGEHIKIKFELADDLGAVKVDPGQFEQVLMNLAVNARDAMPDGGILTIGTSNAELDEEYARMHVGVSPGQYVSLTVSDSGCGIKPELLNHVFEPFFTTKEIGKGTGLGLATVYGIVKQHGGNIWVYSEPEHGTAFKTYLPRVMDEISAVATAEPSNTCTGTETILIVEDDPFVLKVAQGILTSFGYHILSATLPSQAELVLAEHGDTIALMLTDILMPERNGHQLYESVHARFPRMRVLYMSGYPADVIDNQGVLDSNAVFISKPFTANALGRKVRDILDA